MAVSAIELKPRGALALFDSAVRLCARNSGAWALTLPGGALVTWAALRLVDAIHVHGDVLVPAVLFTFAWLARGIFMGAACHYLDELVIGAAPPTTWRSLRAALSRAPSLIVASVYLPFFNALSLGCTAGLGYFFLSSHLVGYAVTMKGKGNPLALYGTSARMLGPAKSHAPVVRWLFAVIVLVGLNLHIAANGLIYLGRKLGGIDLTYAQRFTSLDNTVWVVVVCALSFTLFEPLRAAVGTLLLIDGRVRQEGLDLTAAVEQLPKRKTKKSAGAAGVAAAVLLCMIGALASGTANAEGRAKPTHRSTGSTATKAAKKKPAPPRAEEDRAGDDSSGAYGDDQPSDEGGGAAYGDDSADDSGGVVGGVVGGLGAADDDEDSEDDDEAQAPVPPTGGLTGTDTSKLPPVDRLIAAATACRYSGNIRAELQGAERLGPAEQQSLKRLADDVDLYTWTWRDCGTALARLEAAMPLVQQSITATDAASATTASDKAKEILARPEFVPIPERVKAPPDKPQPEPDDPNSLWARFWRWLDELLRKLFDREPDVTPPPALGAGSGLAVSSFIALLLVVAVVLLVAVILFLALRGKSEDKPEFELETSAVGKDAPDPMSALSRPPEGWAHLADELAAKGDFREAVRSLYLALLSRLHRIGAIDYDPTLSNWDYARQFRGHREWVPTFKDLTLRFDFAWYGHVEVNREGYTTFRALTEPILAAPAEGAPGVPIAPLVSRRPDGGRPNA